MRPFSCRDPARGQDARRTARKGGHMAEEIMTATEGEGAAAAQPSVDELMALITDGLEGRL